MSRFLNAFRQLGKHKALLILLAAVLVVATVCSAVAISLSRRPEPAPASSVPTMAAPVSSAEVTSTVTSQPEVTSTVTSAPPSSKTPISVPSPTPTTSREIPVPDKVCYLTFDDGPSNNTLKILDILDRYNAKATFFVVSTSKLSYIQQAHAKGHAIGLHANVHDYKKIYASENAFFSDLTAISDKVYAQIGIRPAITRFPGGSSNTTSKFNPGIMTRLTKAIREKGYQYYDWNIDSNDASGNKVPADEIYNSVVSQTRNGTRKELCVLMHDTDAKNTTVEALPRIIEELRYQGYEFLPLDPSVGGFHHGVNN